METPVLCSLTACTELMNCCIGVCGQSVCAGYPVLAVNPFSGRAEGWTYRTMYEIYCLFSSNR